ncbi:Spermidine/spermine N(1)-acetyltransferase [Kordia antarctica]|uniref:Spermidine/spermine N(1)-acetyltransferase n=1 Tax=Kordia antarctica TaxID=1218801 RepID=A0A7L4ZR70_9FLAO|nr:GNAT family N-acetyltransferase [Kordia antarctica]QHI39112.1 Spermidine/spermine N(1)-acetyltransferase [Kordia antarctica]
MIQIRKATIDDINLIADIGKTTFLETYLVNTPKTDVESFIEKAFNLNTLAEELRNPTIEYYLLYADKIVIGYAKIILDTTNPNIASQRITKLDRFYVLKEFHGQNVGSKLFKYTIEASKKYQQQGMWLYVWIENKRAINFYTKNNFKKVGVYDFVLSETRSNPNDVLFLEY